MKRIFGTNVYKSNCILLVKLLLKINVKVGFINDAKSTEPLNVPSSFFNGNILNRIQYILIPSNPTYSLLIIGLSMISSTNAVLIISTPDALRENDIKDCKLVGLLP